MLTTNERLRLLMAHHDLTRRAVCDLLGMPVQKYNSSNPRLDKWLSGRNPMPAQMLELLELKLRDKP